MKRASALLLVLVIVAVPAFAKRRSVGAPRVTPSSVYLDAAKQTASWLAAVERRGPNGSSWPSSDRSSYASPGLGSGAAGIGAFHLRLYQATRETQYLDTARNAAAFVAGEYRGGREGGYDWQSGAVGGGELFVLMYRETGETKYLDDAKMTANILLRQAKSDASGTHWEFTGNPNVFTGIVHGSAGAGVFFLHLYELTGETRYLDLARDIYKWMRNHTVPIGKDGIGWKRLTKDAVAYHGFCGGSSGIIYFIDELARATNDANYRADLTATANGLANAAVRVRPDEVAWRYSSDGGRSNPVIYCHGTSCASTALLQAFTATGDERYRDLVRAAAKHLGSIATTVKGDGPVWPHIEEWEQIESGFQTGTASVGYTFLRLHAVLGEPEYLDRAIAAGDWLLRAADRPAPGQMRWINYQQLAPGSSSTPAYETGWYAGAAGIGLFLIDLHERTIGRPPLDRFSIVHP